MAFTVDEVIADAKALLNEAANTPVAELDAGDNSAPVRTTDQQMILFFNQAAAYLARHAVPVSGTATLSWSASTQIQGLAAFSGATFWYPLELLWAGSPVDMVTMAELFLLRKNLRETAAAPTVWYRKDRQAVGLYPVPTQTQTVQLAGYVIPTSATAGTDTVSWAPDTLRPTLAQFVAGMTARKAMEDATLYPRAETWFLPFDRTCLMLWETLEPRLRGATPFSTTIFLRPPPLAGQG